MALLKPLNRKFYDAMVNMRLMRRASAETGRAIGLTGAEASSYDAIY
jgi:hypothetical protein